MGKLQISVSELSLQMRQQAYAAHRPTHWLHLTGPALLAALTLPLPSSPGLGGVVAASAEAGAGCPPTERGGGHDLARRGRAGGRTALSHLPPFTPAYTLTPRNPTLPSTRVQVAELQQLARQQEGTAETAAQLRELTTILYKSWATVQQLAADKAHATAEASPGRRRLAEASPAAARRVGLYDA